MRYFLLAALLAFPAASDLTPAALVASLDECIQMRFSDAKPYFGAARIAPPRHNMKFVPETEQERWAVEKLEAANADVAAYLATPRMTIAGPIAILGEPPAIDRDTLQRRARQSYRQEPASFTLEGWNWITRPIRATQKSCLTCHMRRYPNVPVKAGDLLGVMLYAYRTPES